MSFNLLPLEEQFPALLAYLDTLTNENHPEEMRPSYLRRLVMEASHRPDLPRDKICRWLGYSYGIIMARHPNLTRIFSFNEPKFGEDFSGHPIVRASLQVLGNLHSTMLRRQKLMASDGDRPDSHYTEDNDHVSNLIEKLIEDAMLDAKYIGVNALSLRVGFIQGYMVSYHFLDVSEERNITRPIFHKAYEELGIRPPKSVAISKREA
ncbi:hypothetical protein [Mesorhizobium sp. SP-1A]|uniref:hypothetical protein n=1 Tax=Mesorhizobium sp. SP-1A TaxID=3077840 RepID=UPI0028F6CADC|nr:hypothetical protein [Mesorhizobium sp. SP-1A]